jgi:hypothetical protein
MNRDSSHSSDQAALGTSSQSLGDLADRIEKIERYLGIHRQPKDLGQNPIEVQGGIDELQSAPAHAKLASAKATGSFSGNWLGGIAVVCFVLAAGFIIKLSIESGWLTPVRQVGIAALFGLVLIAAGLILRDRVRNEDLGYISYLPAAGVITLYLTCFTAHLGYKLIDMNWAVGLSACISAICVWLYSELRHDIYAITAAVGAYLAPVIVDSPGSSIFAVYYFAICSIAFAIIAAWIDSRILTAVSAYLAIFVTGSLGLQKTMPIAISTALAFHFVVFTLGTFSHTKRTQKPLSEKEAYAFFPVLLVFYVLEYGIIQSIAPGLAPWISLVFAGFLFAVYIFAQNQSVQQRLASQGMILSFVTVVLFHSVYLELIPDSFRPWLFSVLMFGFGVSSIAFPIRAEISSPKSIPTPWRVPVIAIAIVILIEYVTTVFRLIGESREKVLAVGILSLAAAWTAIALRRDKSSESGFNHIGILAAAHVLAILALYQLADPAGSFAVSSCWLIYAGGVIGFAFCQKDKWMAKSAMMVLALAAAKALLYDTSEAPAVVRIACLLLTGLVLYGSGFALRRVDSWQAEIKPANNSKVE